MGSAQVPFSSFSVQVTLESVSLVLGFQWPAGHVLLRYPRAAMCPGINHPSGLLPVLDSFFLLIALPSPKDPQGRIQDLFSSSPSPLLSSLALWCFFPPVSFHSSSHIPLSSLLSASVLLSHLQVGLLASTCSTSKYHVHPITVHFPAAFWRRVFP